MDINTPGKELFTLNNGKYFRRYLKFASSLITQYKGVPPFHVYLKKYFSLNKKHGLKDRKEITFLCYNFFRLGKGGSQQLTLDNKFLLGAFLNNSTASSKQETVGDENMNLIKKLKAVENIFDLKNVFPFQSELSDKIDPEKFALSFLQQPKFFIRLRPGKELLVIEKINSAGFLFEKINEHCLAFSHNENITGVINIDREAVIQDYNSQRVFDFFQTNSSLINITGNAKPIDVWDCCAGSGGKSILAIDTFKNIKLTVTDKRESILQNLQKRLAAAGIKDYDSLILDLASKKYPALTTMFKLIIADVPCSGSGTWSRTPEQLSFFDNKEINKYASLQKKIIENSIANLSANGIFIYITCSVFKKENEDNIEYILEKFQFKLLHIEYLKGYEIQADTLFVAILIKN